MKTIVVHMRRGSKHELFDVDNEEVKSAITVLRSRTDVVFSLFHRYGCTYFCGPDVEVIEVLGK